MTDIAVSAKAFVNTAGMGRPSGVEVVTVTDTYEVIVIGGGTAGLSAALVLGRARRRTLVIDAGEPRNAPAAHMQGYLSRDGMSPAEFLALGREEITRYGVDLVRDRAVDVTQGDDFAVALAGGETVHARRLVIATGLKDELPGVPESPSASGGT
jgi:thioredoxin reductase